MGKLREAVEQFPSTNAKIILEMILFTSVVIVVLVGIILEKKMDEGIITILLGAILTYGGVTTYQKVKKWQEMPESTSEEPSANAQSRNSN